MISNVQVNHLKQIFKFGVVGGLATLMNSVMFLVFVNSFKIAPLFGNFLAFLCSFSISYFGHARWTFDNQKHSKEKLIKFLIVSLMGLMVNSLFVWIVIHLLHQSAIVVTIPMMFITPLVIFYINKLWIFKN